MYWNVGVQLCRFKKCAPSLLLHPTDFMDLQDVPEMKTFPAMGIAAERKMALVDYTLSSLKKHWAVGTIADHAYAHSPVPANVVPFPAAA
jgi:hypothetical protein